MAGSENKENVAPFTSSDPLQRKHSSPSKKGAKKGRSKSIGPGDIDKPESVKQDAKNRRKSAFVPASKSIISTEAEKAARQAARRRTLANRRVSFAPEATLHTWDVIEFMRDHTASTDSSDQTRRASNTTRSSNGGTSFNQSHALSSDDEEPPSTPPEQEEEPQKLPASPAPQRDLDKKQRRRSSGIPPMNFNNPEDEFSSSGVSDSGDVSGSDDEEDDDDESEDATGTAMSLDPGEETVQSSESGSSTSSSLSQRLKEAAQVAGTRGIEYDEHGEGTMSMEIAGEEITNAFQPWAQRATVQSVGSASLDQENINPFSPAFKAQIASGLVTRPATIEEENTGDMSMDVTHAVGGIMKAQAQQRENSPLGDGTMEFTQAIAKIHATGQKRRRSTTEAGSPGAEASAAQSKRSRRSSVARSSMGDDTMDLTIAIGGIQDAASPAKNERKRSVARRRSSGIALEPDDATMDLTQAVGGIKAAASRLERTTSSIDENEELTMELTTVLGGIKAAEKAAAEARPVTPQQSQSPANRAANTTPKDQERFKDAPDSGPKKLLTPLFQKQVSRSAEKSGSADKRRQSITPAKISWTGAVFDETQKPQQDVEAHFEAVLERQGSPLKNEITCPELPVHVAEPTSPVRATPVKTPPSRRSVQQQLLDEQLQAAQPSPIMQKVLRSSPVKAALTPERPTSSQDDQPHDARTLVDSIRLMSTPRKEILKNVTPKKSAAKQTSPVRHATPRPRPTPKGPARAKSSPAKQLSDDMLRLRSGEQPREKIQLQDFLEDAGIRFMDLTATKRRLTTAPTPSKAQRHAGTDEAEEPVEPDLSLETAIVAAACTQPEHDMFQHACHELKHYISEGKKVIKQLESDTYQDAPPLIRAYVNASTERKATLDSQMRDMKTNARFCSKEMWYAWRSQLLEDLMKGLSGIGEGLLRDDEVLQHAEHILNETLPALLDQHSSLQQEAERLEEAAAAISDEEKEELETARARLTEVDDELAEKQKVLEQLRQDAREQEKVATDLQDSKAEFTAAIQEAERVREACRGVSLNEIAALKESVKNLEETYGWSITSASSSPPTVTLSYRSQLQLFFHPAAFQVPTQPAKSRPNAPISLVYIAQDRQQQSKELTTTLRFFLQLLRASLQALPQSTTRVADLLGLVSSGWDTALSVAEAKRRLNVETLTDSRIVSDERLAIESTILLPKVRTKVRVAFELLAAVGEGMQLSTTLAATAKVVYGEQYNETKMTKFVNERVADVADGWSNAVRGLREKLVATGARGFKK